MASQPTRLVTTSRVCVLAQKLCCVTCVTVGRTASRKPGGYENSWHWPRDTQLKEDAHRYREPNGVQIMATLRSLAMNTLRLDGFWSIIEGLAALAHDIRGLLALLGWR